MNFIVNVAIAIWMTSSLFMLFFYFNALITYAREGRKFRLPLSLFLWVTFMPIVHTRKCFKIMKRSAELAKERGM